MIVAQIPALLCGCSRPVYRRKPAAERAEGALCFHRLAVYGKLRRLVRQIADGGDKGIERGDGHIAVGGVCQRVGVRHGDRIVLLRVAACLAVFIRVRHLTRRAGRKIQRDRTLGGQLRCFLAERQRKHRPLVAHEGTRLGSGSVAGGALRRRTLVSGPALCAAQNKAEHRADDQTQAGGDCPPGPRPASAFGRLLAFFQMLGVCCADGAQKLLFIHRKIPPVSDALAVPPAFGGG